MAVAALANKISPVLTKMLSERIANFSDLQDVKEDTNQVLVGAVIGFVSDNGTQTFLCDRGRLEDGTDVSSAVDVDHVGIMLKTLKAYHDPKKLIFLVVNEFINDGDDIFGKMAQADRDWLGGDHLNAGATLGMALRRSFVGEFNEALYDICFRTLQVTTLTYGGLNHLTDAKNVEPFERMSVGLLVT